MGRRTGADKAGGDGWAQELLTARAARPPPTSPLRAPLVPPYNLTSRPTCRCHKQAMRFFECDGEVWYEDAPVGNQCLGACAHVRDMARAFQHHPCSVWQQQ